MGMIRDCYYVICNTLYGTIICDRYLHAKKFINPSHAGKYIASHNLNTNIYKIKAMGFKQK